MSKASQAAEGLSNLAKQYKSVLDAAEFIRELGDLDAAILDFKAQKQTALDDMAITKGELEGVKGELTLAVSELNEVRAGITAQRKEADAVNSDLRAEAEREAKRIVAEAQAEADEIRGEMVDYKSEADTYLAGVKQEIADAQAQLDGIKAEIAATVERISGKA